ncbi:hypothetical protein PTSG_10125 [Salpingoeca rosetta]|uniref:Uncharacterized protein n=1 Tax=Salpingoeca rosetta (strain ATCC 50818 / BSB-021) TaxID=946362 RepID=F2UQD4_SALR5|nr:uncharacterized protein PTSG_10125 [Salpingoeca rosetta]EGD79839.1 hypothetical protein PTSG_10125 [Salpingoeca rosetta]|eukprot:XP_004988460.1 hypothetical protein PTSG_10125 [Salpingoeca rosetta]
MDRTQQRAATLPITAHTHVCAAIRSRRSKAVRSDQKLTLTRRKMVERISMEEGDDGKKAATANHGDKGGRLAAELLGGTVGGILQVLVGHPLDTVKVRMQSSSYYRGVWHCMSETAQKEGLRGFYKGVGPPIVMSGALNAALFGTNGFMKRVVATAFDTRPDALSMPQVVLAAVMTAPVYCTILAPVEMIKCRLQVQRFGAKRQYSGPFDVIRQTIAHDGIKGIFAGYRITVLTLHSTP